jgi:hypothetical protein
MINCKVQANGDLLVTADNEARNYIREHIERGYWTTFYELFEPFFTNGSYEPFDAGNADPFVGLTSAPCIAEAICHPDEGPRKVDGRLWWFPNYMVCDPLDELKNKGRTVFALAE